jgi:hypothetical protein
MRYYMAYTTIGCSYMRNGTDYGHTKAKSLILCGPNSNPNPYEYLGWGYKRLIFCRSNGWIMKNMDKGLTVPKWVLIVWPKIPKMLQNLFAQFVCPKVWDSNEKRLHRASVVHAQWLVGYKRSNEGCVKHLIIKQTPSFNKVTCSVLSILVRGWQKRTPYS